MKRFISLVIVWTLLLSLCAVAVVHAETVNRTPVMTTEEAVSAAKAQTGSDIRTHTLYFKMPQLDNWYSDYGVYRGKYYASVYWFEGAASEAPYPGYRTTIVDYDQGIYSAEVPEDVPEIFWCNGFRALDGEKGTEVERQVTCTVNLNAEGAEIEEYETLPEGSPDPASFDGCIFVVEPHEVYLSADEKRPYTGNWYIYYGDGCYGSYAQTSENFTSAEENCLNPEHFDAEGRHIGGAHIKAPEAPDKSMIDENSSLNGYYLLTEHEHYIRTENKLAPSADNSGYVKRLDLSPTAKFKIVFYQVGQEIEDLKAYPESGYYNEDGCLLNQVYDNMLYFNPVDGSVKVEKLTPEPTEAPTAPADDPYAANMYYGQTENRFTDRFMAHYVSMHTNYWGYCEAAYHYDDDGSIDWALIYADMDFSSPMPFLCIIGNRVIFHGDYMNPFYSGYAVYDVKNDTFTDVLGENYRPTHKDFTEVFDGIQDGRLLGDLDGDNEISIIDATILQRCDVGIRSYPEDDALILDGVWYERDEKTAYYSDFNRDGERDILDATAIRRYLVHMPYLAE